MNLNAGTAPTKAGIISELLLTARVSPTGVANWATSRGNCEASAKVAPKVAAYATGSATCTPKKWKACLTSTSGESHWIKTFFGAGIGIRGAAGTKLT